MKIFLQIVLFFSVIGLNAQSFTDVSFTVNPNPVPNPERGFYHQVDDFDGETLQNFKEKGVRLILKNYSLEGFNNQALSSTLINGIKNDFDIVRAAGFKIIVRFAYKFQVTTPYGDAPLDIVLLHISQLKQVLQENSDIILTLQAGFIGTWGEWYYTDYFSQSPGVISEQNWKDRRTVVDALLDVLPEDRMIQLRTPTFKKKMAELTDWNPITLAEAYNGSTKSRLAFHNDCFVANSSDYGTYNNIAIEKAYLENDTKYMIVGGETCNPSNQSNCVNSVAELERFHWSFLNLDYHQGVLNQWKNEGCWDEIATKLGFRYELIDAHLQNEAKPMGKLDFSIKLMNTGWANPTNSYSIQLNLRNTASQNIYSYIIYDDIRKWPLGVAHILNVSAGLPSDIPLGDYKLSLVIKDGRESLSFDPSYRIQMANIGTWNAEKGENETNHTLTVVNDANLPSYSGSNYFLKEGTITPNFDGPKLIKVATSNHDAIVYWTREKQNDNELVRLQRSTDNMNFETIAINNIDDIAYIDRDVAPNQTYYYRAQYVSGAQYSQMTNIVYNAPALTDLQFLNIEIDGSIEDWNMVPPVATAFKNGMVDLRFMNTSTHLYFMLEAPSFGDTYHIILEMNAGKKFKISDGNLSEYNQSNGQWIILKSLETKQSDSFIEGKIPLDDIDFVENTSFEGEFAIGSTSFWEDKFQFGKNPILSIPEKLEVTPSAVTPLSKVKLSWKLLTNIDGFIIERSIGDNQHFEFLKDLTGTPTYYLDDNLDSDVLYYYRVFVYKGIIRSEYSQNVSIQLNKYTSIASVENPIEKVKIFPNPMNDFSTIELFAAEKTDCSINLYDLGMTKVEEIYDGSILGKKKIEFQRKSLPSGLYFLKIQTVYNSQIHKIVIF